MTEPNEARKDLTDAKRIVVKVSTNSLTDENSKLDNDKIEKLVDDLMDLIEQDKELILVSSGAIGAGVGKLNLEEVPKDMEALQAASTIGQGALMRNYSESFEKYDLQVAQLLLTQQDFTNPDRFRNFKNTVEVLSTWGVVPIINENDAVAVEEIRMGDNDLLSAFTASGASADLLIMLTDVDGLYTGDPKKEKDAEPIRIVEEVSEEIEKIVEESSGDDFGGMTTKVQAAKMATDEGIPVVVTDARKEKVLKRIIEGNLVGTLFLPRK